MKEVESVKLKFKNNRKWLKLIVCVGLSVLLTSTVAAGEVLYWGSRGDSVKEVQRRLKQWDYYGGSVDGVYGTETQNAVKQFQRNNGLTPDGVVGQGTASKMGIQLSGSAGASNEVNSDETYLLARTVYAESRGEPYEGQVAVAAVVLNRTRNPSFPDSIAGVVYQKDAFTAVNDGQINLTPNNDAMRAAKDAMNGWDPSYGAIYYYNPQTAIDRWIFSRPVHCQIGKHVFAK
jgi:N-acetylmuramoyl-L-alanine amidase